jgi:DNA-binding NarL/FixJ family response regulator
VPSPPHLAAGAELVGREVELRNLDALLSSAQSGTGAVAVLVADAGVGKTRTAREFAAAAKHDGAVRVLFGSCYEGDASPPYTPWGEALSSYVRSTDADSLRGRLGGAASVLARVVPELREKLGLLSPAPPLAAEEERVRLYEAVVTALARGPETFVVVLDDLHWADRASLELLEYVGRSIGSARTLIVATHRDVEPTHPLAECLAELNRRRVSTTIRLATFTEDETVRLLERLAGGNVAPAAAGVVYRETGGNPFFIEEVVRQFLDEGRDLSQAPTGDWQIPDSIRHALAYRLTRLSPDANRLLNLAAALSGAFEFEVLHALADMPEEVLLDCLDEALAAKLIRPAGITGEEYEFTHALVRHSLYEQLNPSRKARLHRRIAEALERVYAGRTRMIAGELAGQYYRSLTIPGAAHGVPHALEAAADARDAPAPQEAVRFLQMAHALSAESEPAVRAGILARLAVVVAEALAVDTGHGRVREALDALADVGASGPEIAKFLGDACWALKTSGAGEEVLRPLVERGLELAGNERDLAWARLKLVLHPVEQRRADGIHYGLWLGFDPEAVAIARRSEDKDDYARTLEPMDWRTVEEARALQSLVRSWRQPSPQIHSLTVVARSFLYRNGAFAEASQAARELLTLGEQHGSVTGQAYALVMVAELEAAFGEFADSRLTSERARELVSRLGPGHRLHSMVGNADALLLEFVGGDWEAEAEEETRLALTPVFRWGWFNLPSAAGAARANAALGERARAERFLAPLAEAARRQPPTTVGQSDIVWSAGTATWELDLVEYADRYRVLALQLLESGAGDSSWSSSELTVARMATLLDRRAEALEYFALARASTEASGRRPLRAIVDHDEAVARSRLGETGVDALVASAQLQFEELAMDRWIERATRLAASFSTRRPSAPAGLSARELEVLRLLAGGRTNKEIASALVVSVHTVERHLANAYRKIGARNRAEATAFALAHELEPL